MPNICASCKHTSRSDIDRWIADGVTLVEISQRLSELGEPVTRQALARHRDHRGAPISAIAEWQQTHPGENLPRNRHYQLAKYGLTALDFEEMSRVQSGVCAICGEPPGPRRLAVDHDHHTGTIRGLLCFRCNVGLGYFRDDPERLLRAVSYLRRHTLRAA